jgi:hypothetical protein
MKGIKAFLSTRKGEYFTVLLFFFLLAVVFTWPLILHFSNGVLGGTGDPMLNSWIISWDAHTLFTRPFSLFQGNILYPSRDVIAYSEHLFTLGLLAAPVYWTTRNPVSAYNFLLYFGFVFSGFGCYLLVKELTGSRWAGLAGGVFFALCPYKISRLPHLQIMFSPFLPFLLLFLHRYLDRGGGKNLFLFAAFFLAQSLSSWHYLAYSALAAGLMWLWSAFFRRGEGKWRRLAATAAAVAVVALFILPFSLPYLRAHSRLPGFERSLNEVKGYSAGWEDYLRVLPESLVYGDAPSPFRRGFIGYEQVLYPGVVILLLALAAFLVREGEGSANPPAFRSSSWRNGALYFLALGAAAFILTLGPEVGGWSNPFYTIPYRLGLLKFTRVPARFFVLLSLSLAVLGGFGLAKLSFKASGSTPDMGRLRLTAAALLILLVVELVTFNIPVYRVPVGDEVPEVYRWLAEQEDARVIELPTLPLRGTCRYDRDLDLIPLDTDRYFSREGLLIYFSTYHWKPMANGYSGYFPYFYNRIFLEMQGFPSERTLHLLWGLGINYVIWDWSVVPTQRQEEYNVRLFSMPGLTFVGDFGEKSVFRVEEQETTMESGGLEIALEAPDAVPPSSPFNLGLEVRNAGPAAFVRAEEEPQPFTVRFLGGDGETAMEAEGVFRSPFFLEPGEAVVLPLRVESTPPPGLYTLQVIVEGGILGDRSFQREVAVEEMPDSRHPQNLDGTLRCLEEEPIRIPVPEGLFPLRFEVANTGDTLWIAARENKEAEVLDPVGLVHLAVRWEDESGPVWEEQRCTLPCDTAPGQGVEVATLVRPPSAPGKYKLFVGLADEGFSWFGEVQVLEVEVEGWMEEWGEIPDEEAA